MPSIEDVLSRKKPFKKKGYRPYLSLDDVDTVPNAPTASTESASDRDLDRASVEAVSPSAPHADPQASGDTSKPIEAVEPTPTDRPPASAPIPKALNPMAQPSIISLPGKVPPPRPIPAPAVERAANASDLAPTGDVRPQADQKVQSAASSEIGTSESDKRIRLAAISGGMREVLLHLFSQTLNAREKFVTDELSIHELVAAFAETGMTQKRMYNYIRHLKDTEAIYPHETKSGRGGWARYRINRYLYEQILNQAKGQSLVAIPRDLSSSALRPKTQSEVSANGTSGTRASASSREMFDLESDWQAIRLDEASEFGFRETHLRQLFDGQVAENEKSRGLRPLTADQVQNSIDAWTHARKTGKTEAGLNVFMGVVRNRREWSPVEGFKTRKARDAERRARVAAEELEALRAAERAEAELHYLRWKQGLSIEEKQRMVATVPWAATSKPGSQIWESALKSLFDGQPSNGVADTDEVVRADARSAIEAVAHA